MTPTKPEDDLIEIGFVRAAHGLRGQVVVHAYSRHEDSLTAYGDLYNADRSKRFSLSVINAKENDFLCKIKGIDDRNTAEALRGTKFFVPSSALPPTEDDEYYVRDLIGLAVRDSTGQTLGKIFNVIDLGAHQALEITFTHNGEIALPEPQTELLLFNDPNVPEVNIAGGFVMINLPHGLLETPEKTEEDPE
jgi:16S rRNA processing protein RimM